MAVRRKKKKPKKFTPGMQKKLAVLFGAVLFAFIALLGRIAYISASSGQKYERTVLEQQNYSSRIIPFRRGSITDRNGTILANSEKVYHVILDAKVLLSDEKNVDPTLEALESVFGISKEEVNARLTESPDSRYIVLKKGVDYESGLAWEKYLDDYSKKAEEEPDPDRGSISGVWLEEDYHRNYPYGTLACDLLGFTSSGNVGNWGVEQSANDILNGENGREYGYVNEGYGLERTVRPAVNGNDVMLTIDANLQSIVEKHIIRFNEEHKNLARPGEGSENTGVIMMDPDTGEILAMASYPNFDLNKPRDLTRYYTQEQINAMSDEEQLEKLQMLWRNFCVSDTYEPGSTAKVFTVAAAYETGAIQGNEQYYCSGYRHVGDWDIACHLTSGHGTLDLQGAIAQSCNVALMEIAFSVGKENFIRYQQLFGFGQYSGIDVPGEMDTSPLVFHDDNMTDTDLATNSFGQNFNVTMTQMAAAYCSLINGGNYYRPHVIKEVRSESGDIVETKQPELLKDTVTEETSATLRQYMYATVMEGTATEAQVPGYIVGGKTGTAERLPRGNEEYVLSFAGFAPVDKPEVLIYVVVDRVNAYSQEQVSLVTQLASDIMREAFPYLGITRDPNAQFEETYEEEDYLDEYMEDYGEDYDEDYDENYDEYDEDYDEYDEDYDEDYDYDYDEDYWNDEEYYYDETWDEEY